MNWKSIKPHIYAALYNAEGAIYDRIRVSLERKHQTIGELLYGAHQDGPYLDLDAGDYHILSERSADVGGGWDHRPITGPAYGAIEACIAAYYDEKV
jgi:hypothetical protein